MLNILVHTTFSTQLPDQPKNRLSIAKRRTSKGIRHCWVETITLRVPVIYRRGSSSVGKISLKTTTLAIQAVSWLAQTFGHPKNMFLDFAKASSTISKATLFFLWAHVLRKEYSHSAVNLGKALFPIFALALNLPEHFFDDKVCYVLLQTTGIRISHLDHRLNIQQLWWSFYTILLKQAQLTNEPLVLALTRSKIVFSTWSIFNLKIFSWEVSALFWRRHWYFLLMIEQCFTILWQQPDIQALQVLNPDKQWVNAPPIPGSLVIKYLSFFEGYFFTVHWLCTSITISLASAISLHDGQVRLTHFLPLIITY